MRTGGSVLVVCLAALAGCAGAPAGPSDDPDAAAAGVDVKATANTGVIRGVVVDGVVRPLEGVSVTIESATAQRMTSQDGAFGFEALVQGDYQLLARKDGYFSARQSVTVIAGVDDPPVIRFQLAAMPSVEPRFEALQFMLVTGLQYCLPVVGCYSQPGPWDGLSDDERAMPAVQLGPGAVAAQVEFTWQSQTSLAERGTVTCHSRNAAHTVAQSTGESTSPAVQRVGLRANVDSKDVVASSAGCRWLLAAGDVPLAAAHEQQLNAILHVFYHFQPSPDWRFGLDGDPVPGGM